MSSRNPDLTRQAPRSPRVRLGGYAILPRILDKGRALAAGKNGDYKYACPLDQRFFEFTGVEAAPLLKELESGRSDSEILEWIGAHGRRPATADIEAWSAWQERRAPSDPDSRDYFNKLHAQVAPSRTDIVTWFDLLDLDDYVSFGGKP